MDLQAFRDTCTRLLPLQRMLADLNTAADQVGQVLQLRKEAEEQVRVLDEKAQYLKNQIVNLQNEFQRKKNELGTLNATYASDEKRLSLEHTAFLEKLDQERQRAEAAHAAIHQSLKDAAARLQSSLS
jgi:chromosome segregation ATPase